MLSKKNAGKVWQAIENEGFEYTFRHYTSFKEIKDKEFHRLREAFLKAAKELEDYIGEDPNEDC